MHYKLVLLNNMYKSEDFKYCFSFHKQFIRNMLLFIADYIVQNEEQKMDEAKFKENLNQAINEALSSLGASTKQTMIYHLENSFGLNINDLASNLEGFEEALKSIFGNGAGMIEKLILRQFADQLETEIIIDKETEFNLTSIVESLKKQL